MCFLHVELRLMSLGFFFDEFGRGLGQELGNEFGVDFDEFDEFGGAFVVFFLDLEMCLMSLGVF